MPPIHANPSTSSWCGGKVGNLVFTNGGAKGVCVGAMRVLEEYDLREEAHPVATVNAALDGTDPADRDLVATCAALCHTLRYATPDWKEPELFTANVCGESVEVLSDAGDRSGNMRTFRAPHAPDSVKGCLRLSQLTPASTGMLDALNQHHHCVDKVQWSASGHYLLAKTTQGGAHRSMWVLAIRGTTAAGDLQKLVSNKDASPEGMLGYPLVALVRILTHDPQAQICVTGFSHGACLARQVVLQLRKSPVAAVESRVSLVAISMPHTGSLPPDSHVFYNTEDPFMRAGAAKVLLPADGGPFLKAEAAGKGYSHLPDSVYGNVVSLTGFVPTVRIIWPGIKQAKVPLQQAIEEHVAPLEQLLAPRTPSSVTASNDKFFEPSPLKVQPAEGQLAVLFADGTVGEYAENNAFGEDEVPCIVLGSPFEVEDAPEWDFINAHESVACCKRHEQRLHRLGDGRIVLKLDQHNVPNNFRVTFVSYFRSPGENHRSVVGQVCYTVPVPDDTDVSTVLMQTLFMTLATSSTEWNDPSSTSAQQREALLKLETLTLKMVEDLGEQHPSTYGYLTVTPVLTEKDGVTKVSTEQLPEGRTVFVVPVSEVGAQSELVLEEGTFPKAELKLTGKKKFTLDIEKQGRKVAYMQADHTCFVGKEDDGYEAWLFDENRCRICAAPSDGSVVATSARLASRGLAGKPLRSILMRKNKSSSKIVFKKDPPRLRPTEQPILSLKYFLSHLGRDNEGLTGRCLAAQPMLQLVSTGVTAVPMVYRGERCDHWVSQFFFGSKVAALSDLGYVSQISVLLGRLGFKKANGERAELFGDICTVLSSEPLLQAYGIELQSKIDAVSTNHSWFSSGYSRVYCDHMIKVARQVAKLHLLLAGGAELLCLVGLKASGKSTFACDVFEKGAGGADSWGRETKEPLMHKVCDGKYVIDFNGLTPETKDREVLQSVIAPMAAGCVALIDLTKTQRFTDEPLKALEVVSRSRGKDLPVLLLFTKVEQRFNDLVCVAEETTVRVRIVESNDSTGNHCRVHMWLYGKHFRAQHSILGPASKVMMQYSRQSGVIIRPVGDNLWQVGSTVFAVAVKALDVETGVSWVETELPGFISGNVSTLRLTDEQKQLLVYHGGELARVVEDELMGFPGDLVGEEWTRLTGLLEQKLANFPLDDGCQVREWLTRKVGRFTAAGGLRKVDRGAKINSLEQINRTEATEVPEELRHKAWQTIQQEAHTALAELTRMHGGEELSAAHCHFYVNAAGVTTTFLKSMVVNEALLFGIVKDEALHVAIDDHALRARLQNYRIELPPDEVDVFVALSLKRILTPNTVRELLRRNTFPESENSKQWCSSGRY